MSLGWRRPTSLCFPAFSRCFGELFCKNQQSDNVCVVKCFNFRLQFNIHVDSFVSLLDVPRVWCCNRQHIQRQYGTQHIREWNRNFLPGYRRSVHQNLFDRRQCHRCLESAIITLNDIPQCTGRHHRHESSTFRSTFAVPKVNHSALNLISTLNWLFINRIFLILPEIGINVIGSIWSFCGLIQCLNPSDSFSNSTVEGEI